MSAGSLRKPNTATLKRIAKGLQVAIPIILFVALLSQLDPAQVWETLRTVKWGWVAGGFVLFAGLDIWRALRYHYFMHAPARFLIPATILNGFYNTLLPFRLGELSFAYYLHESGTPLEESIVNLVRARLLDLGVLCAAVLLAWDGEFGQLHLATFKRAAIIFYGIIVALCLLVYCLRRFQIVKGEWYSGFLSFLPSDKSKTVKQWIKAFNDGFTPLAFGLSLFLSLVIWLENVLVSFCLFRATGLSLDFTWIAFAASILQFVSLFPLNFMGGLGVLDLSWVGLLALRGIPLQRASSVIVATRIVFYAYVLAWGLVGQVWWYMVQLRNHAAQPGESELP